jgi:Tol biopolymer transport system component
VILQRDGTLKRSDGEAVANVRGIETIDGSVRDGKIIATRGRDIVRIGIDNGAVETLLTDTEIVRFATISGDGHALLCCSVLTEESGIFLAWRDASGKFGNPHFISSGYGPSISSDSRFIYFERGKTGLARYDMRRGITEPFLPKYAGAHTVRCSPDGRFIAFSSNRALFLYDDTDQSVKKLSNGIAYDRFASFAGEQVLFFRETRRGKQQVVTIGTDAKNERVLYEGDVTLVCAVPGKP